MAESELRAAQHAAAAATLRRADENAPGLLGAAREPRCLQDAQREAGTSLRSLGENFEVTPTLAGPGRVAGGAPRGYSKGRSQSRK